MILTLIFTSIFSFAEPIVDNSTNGKCAINAIQDIQKIYSVANPHYDLEMIALNLKSSRASNGNILETYSISLEGGIISAESEMSYSAAKFNSTDGIVYNCSLSSFNFNHLSNE